MPDQSDIGANLRQTRLLKRLTIERVHRYTRIPIHALDALEENRFSDFPAVYMQSYLRQYCEFLEIPVAILPKPAAAGRQGERASSQAPAFLSAGGNGLFAALNGNFMRLTLACVVLMLVATTWLWRSYDGVAAQDEPGRPPAFGSYIYDAAFVSRLKTSARARVWLRLEADDKTVFEGYLPASASKEWKASRRFTLWLRRPENVTVTLDNKTFGPSVLKTGRNVIPVTFSGFN